MTFKTECYLINARSELVCIRMISSMSSQVAELKTILSTSSRLSSTFRPIARVDVASSNSDSSSTDSDFTFPAPVSNPEPVSSADSNSFQLVVQDITAGEESGQSKFHHKCHCASYLLNLITAWGGNSLSEE